MWQDGEPLRDRILFENFLASASKAVIDDMYIS